MTRTGPSVTSSFCHLLKPLNHRQRRFKFHRNLSTGLSFLEYLPFRAILFYYTTHSYNNRLSSSLLAYCLPSSATHERVGDGGSQGIGTVIRLGHLLEAKLNPHHLLDLLLVSSPITG